MLLGVGGHFKKTIGLLLLLALFRIIKDSVKIEKNSCVRRKKSVKKAGQPRGNTKKIYWYTIKHYGRYTIIREGHPHPHPHSYHRQVGLLVGIYNESTPTKKKREANEKGSAVWQKKHLKQRFSSLFDCQNPTADGYCWWKLSLVAKRGHLVGKGRYQRRSTFFTNFTIKSISLSH